MAARTFGCGWRRRTTWLRRLGHRLFQSNAPQICAAHRTHVHAFANPRPANRTACPASLAHAAYLCRRDWNRRRLFLLPTRRSQRSLTNRAYLGPLRDGGPTMGTNAPPSPSRYGDPRFQFLAPAPGWQFRAAHKAYPRRLTDLSPAVRTTPSTTPHQGAQSLQEKGHAPRSYSRLPLTFSPADRPARVRQRCLSSPPAPRRCARSTRRPVPLPLPLCPGDSHRRQTTCLSTFS